MGAEGGGGCNQVGSSCRGFRPGWVGRDWARIGRTAGWVEFCTGADADRLKDCSADVVRLQIERGLTHMGNAAEYEGGGNMGYCGYMVSCSGIWLREWLELERFRQG